MNKKETDDITQEEKSNEGSQELFFLIVKVKVLKVRVLLMITKKSV